jgi:hypothetical protein
VGLQPHRFDAVAHGADLRLRGMGLHDYKHGNLDCLRVP